MLSPVKTTTSIFGSLVDGTDEGECRDGGVNGDECCKGVGSGNRGGCDEVEDDGLSSCYSFNIISAMTDCWAARELRRMSKDSAWFFLNKSNDSECRCTIEHRDSILEKAALWQES